jgi:hypothetical protein
MTREYEISDLDTLYCISKWREVIFRIVFFLEYTWELYLPSRTVWIIEKWKLCFFFPTEGAVCEWCSYGRTCAIGVRAPLGPRRSIDFFRDGSHSKPAIWGDDRGCRAPTPTWRATRRAVAVVRTYINIRAQPLDSHVAVRFRAVGVSSASRRVAGYPHASTPVRGWSIGTGPSTLGRFRWGKPIDGMASLVGLEATRDPTCLRRAYE